MQAEILHVLLGHMRKGLIYELMLGEGFLIDDGAALCSLESCLRFAEDHFNGIHLVCISGVVDVVDLALVVQHLGFFRMMTG